jgi:hypothetical protein
LYEVWAKKNPLCHKLTPISRAFRQAQRDIRRKFGVAKPSFYRLKALYREKAEFAFFPPAFKIERSVRIPPMAGMLNFTNLLES